MGGMFFGKPKRRGDLWLPLNVRDVSAAKL
jgi:hypothetical protein